MTHATRGVRIVFYRNCVVYSTSDSELRWNVILRSGDSTFRYRVNELLSRGLIVIQNIV